MDRLQNSFMTIDQVKDAYLNHSKDITDNNSVSDGLDFKQILERTKDDNKSGEMVTFSKHANERLESRNINLSDDQMTRLNKGIMQAKEKSIKESLVMMDDIAFIVNIKNNTVITAIEQQAMDSNVFTNIDGAVIV